MIFCSNRFTLLIALCLVVLVAGCGSTAQVSVSPTPVAVTVVPTTTPTPSATLTWTPLPEPSPTALAANSEEDTTTPGIGDAQAIEKISEAVSALGQVKSGRLKESRESNPGTGWVTTMEFTGPNHLHITTVRSDGVTDESYQFGHTEYKKQQDGGWSKGDALGDFSEPYLYTITQGDSVAGYISHLYDVASAGSDKLDSQLAEVYRYKCSVPGNNPLDVTIWISSDSGMPLKYRVHGFVPASVRHDRVDVVDTLLYYDFNAKIDLQVPGHE